MSIKQKSSRLTICAVGYSILLSFLSACGGGSGGSGSDPGGGYSPPPTPPPTTIILQQNAPESASSSIGQIFINEQGLTLYTFENDRNDTDGDGLGDSDCNASCADTWPPLFADANSQASGQFTIISRDDGEPQWAFKGLPLYKFNTDVSQGDINGEGIDNIWFVARPDPFKTAEVNASATGTVFVGDFSIFSTDGAGGMSPNREVKDGFTLYTFENDRNDTDGDGVGDSDCNLSCAEIWPPLFADPGSTVSDNFSIIVRDDGTSQWAHQGLPLYFFASDTATGETNGEGVDGLWFVARPAATKVASSSLGSIIVAATSVPGVDGAGGIDVDNRARSDFSLYVFDDDVNDANGDGPGDSDCNGGCAEIWPPMFADPGAVPGANFSIISRDDGSSQWAYKGEPLYFFASDTASGDVNGDQVDGTWHLARTAPLQVTTDATLGDILAARGIISDVTNSGARAQSTSDKTGFVVYSFDDDISDADGDGSGDSDCNASCAVTWPPLYADEADQAAGDFSIISRDDNSLQWVYKGLPLYFFAPDPAAGATTGVYGTWHEVNP